MASVNNSRHFTDDVVLNKIYFVRGQKVMLDTDLAAHYQVETKVLNQAVKRNRSRFPKDFMFQLTRSEFKNLKSQFVTSSWGGIRKLPFAFTEQGVAMLSGVLKSRVAIRVHIQIIRVFARMRELLTRHKEILVNLEKIEKRLSKHDHEILVIFNYLKQLLHPPSPPRNRIGFRRKNES